MKAKRSRLRKKIRICTFILFIEVLALTVTSSYAWYVYDSRRSINSAKAQVERMIELNLLDDTASKSLQLFVGNLYPGQKNDLVLCISNNPMDGTNRPVSDIGYELKLAHTENLPVTYSLTTLNKVAEGQTYDVMVDHSKDGQENTYFVKVKECEQQAEPPVEPVSGAGVAAEDEKAWVNTPVYQVYNDDFMLSMHDGSYDENYYLLEIEMPKELPDGIVFNNIIKEVDMVYIIASIRQLQ